MHQRRTSPKISKNIESTANACAVPLGDVYGYFILYLYFLTWPKPYGRRQAMPHHTGLS